MINNNKILTVSYGTFSCTLEGFDDSFGTMKAIAEYFRDLSADDRYFGAEPVQPDAQMLARIAQREISRHVEAREDEGRIVLSAQEATPKPATPLAADTAENVAEDVIEDVAEAVAEAVVAKAPSEDAPDIPAALQGTDTVTTEEITTPKAPLKAADKVVAQDNVAVEAIPDVPQKEVTADQPDIVPSLPDADVEAFFADSATSKADDIAEFEDAGEDDDIVTIPAEQAQERAKANSIADKLKRIRAVVSQQGDTADAPDYSEDQHADGAAVQPQTTEAHTVDLVDADVVDALQEPEVDALDETAEADVLADTLRDLEDALDADDVVEAQEPLDEDLESEEDNIAAILSRLEDENKIETSEDSSKIVLVESASDLEDDDLDHDILAAMDSIVAAPDEDDLDDLSDENLFDGEEAAPLEDLATQEQEPVVAPVRTRVLKVKRATLEAAIQAGKLEEYDDEAKAPVAKSSLSDEAEEELARELAELEADMNAGETQQAIVEDFDDVEEVHSEQAEAPAPTKVSAPLAQRADIRGNAEQDLSRLMDETNSQMGEPEGATRRDAFAHLRAAVAAKKADEAVGGELGKEDSDEAYRDDLANVVRPRRTIAGQTARTKRPTEQRPAPLKLVAEQRIDVAETASAAPVRPRRVAAVVPTPTPSAGSPAASFSDFAADVGADALPDLLEAAAAYLSFVEGLEEFSRPQLMTKVREVEQENFTREESLRSFGKLLREGKIQKLKGGRFQASDQIGFKQDARAAG